MGGKKDHRDLVRRLVLFETVAHLIAVKARHVDIENNNIGVVPARLFQALLAVVRANGGMLILQGVADVLLTDIVVIHYQNSTRLMNCHAACLPNSASTGRLPGILSLCRCLSAASL